MLCKIKRHLPNTEMFYMKARKKINSHVHYHPADCLLILICQRKLAVSSSERHSQDCRDARESWGVRQDQHDPRQPRRCCGTRIDISYRRMERNPSPSDIPCWGPSQTVDTVSHKISIIPILSSFRAKYS